MRACVRVIACNALSIKSGTSKCPKVLIKENEYFRTMSESKWDTRAPPPDAKAMTAEKNYTQTYVIMKERDADPEAKLSEGNEILFRCGSWCYRGLVQFNGLHLTVSEIPILIPTLQRQQASLRYFCNSNAVPLNSDFYEPMKFLSEAADFFASEMVSEEIEDELKKLSSMFPWIDDDNSTTYFELLLADVPPCMDQVALVASKVYIRGLIIISIYNEGTVYYVIQSGEGDQALLDVRFPDVTKRGQGMHLASYVNASLPYKKLTLWHMVTFQLTFFLLFPILSNILNF